ncbi:MAG: hypothetical protein ACI39R_04530 [Lachnospiraceae bacterium]
MIDSYFRTFPDTFSKNPGMTIDVPEITADIEDCISDSITEGYTLVSRTKTDEFLSIDKDGDYILLTFWELTIEGDGQQKETIAMTVTELEID